MILVGRRECIFYLIEIYIFFEALLFFYKIIWTLA